MDHNEAEMQEFREQLNQLTKTTTSLAADSKQIKTALIGDKELGTTGFAQMVKANSEYISEDKKFKAKAVGFLGALQLLGFGFLKLITDLTK